MPLSTTILPPVRCFTCGAIVGGKALRFRALVGGEEARLTDATALARVGLMRPCCRTCVLSWVGVGAQSLPWPLIE